jgi:anthraniloyl-CoA monooxygenase
MKILIIGGGPGGLYAALLLKRVDERFDIQVVERNPAGATYGWGVVFSDRTLNRFREADPATYQEITDNFVLWQAIDSHYRDRIIRCDGHSFAGIARRKLLSILQNRCRNVGVQLHFETPLTDLSHLDQYDLVVAADGVNSLVRQTYAAAFQPSLEIGKAKYIWFGSDRLLDAFTFIFRENEHGLFQVHAYPFDGRTSTFIVECAEDVWQRAGLDQATESDSIAYCQKLFADFLQGRSLFSNKSAWGNFVTVRNKSWRHENIVLLGDAAHTAHFSIGSGTKIAMEGAISLARAFAARAFVNSRDLDVALNQYEMDRRPVVEILQTAAHGSRVYFENIKRYLRLEPLQFTTHLLTRSGRITYDNLRVRDPYFIDQVDRHFRIANNPSPLTIDNSQLTIHNSLSPPPLFTPFTLRTLTLTNRVVSAPTATAVDGIPTDAYLDQLLNQARGGVGMVLAEIVAVTGDGRITPDCPGLYNESQLAAWQKLVTTIHQETPAKVAIQLNHAGRRGSTRPRREGLDRPLRQGGWPLLAASAIPYTPYSQPPHAMTRADMDTVRDAFVQAARLADQAGFDWLQLQMAHGYLLAGFISPLSNRRDDEYGGMLANRLRFPLELFDAVRAEWPATKPLSVALSASDWNANGLKEADAVTIAATLKAHGCDLIEVLAGHSLPNAAPPAYAADFLVGYSEIIRHEAGIPTLTRGYLTTTGQVNGILAGGRADLCVMERGEIN